MRDAHGIAQPAVKVGDLVIAPAAFDSKLVTISGGIVLSNGLSRRALKTPAASLPPAGGAGWRFREAKSRV